MALPALACLLLAAPLALAGGSETSERVAASIASARKALADGKREDAYGALKVALNLAPASPEVLGLYVEASKTDEDLRTFWQHALARATLAPERTNTLDAAGRKLLTDPRPLQLATALSAAFDELVRFAKEREKEVGSHPESALVAQWARRAALDLAQRSPLVARAHAAELSPRLVPNEALPAKALRALEHLAENSLGNGRMQLALAAALMLKGCATQAGWDKDLQGPKPPGIAGLAKSADELLARVRAEWSKKADKPWSIEELERLGPDEIEAFTRRYGNPGNPALADSPRGWYRIESDCGYAALLGVAKTIELHHQRLVNWYGKDPFTARPGLARIVPEAAELEAHGAPFWWAGGFQSGDTTTLRFSCADGHPSIEGLGHGMTHELTHRFDGTLFPGLPSWLLEGKAVWTGGAFGKAAAPAFVDNYASFGSIVGAYIKGYAAPDKLTKLLDGTLEDYRDNYSAGHALFVYLRSRKDDSGRVLYRDALAEFQTRAKGPKKGLALFLDCFCDGKQGRAANLEKFCADWGPWIGGFYWFDLKPWAKELTEDVGAVSGPEVLDDPVWEWSRSRAEPRFGQGQAERAGELLRAADLRGDAILAYLWALGAGGRMPEVERELARELDEENRKDAAWCLRSGLAFPFDARSGPPPFLGQLSRCSALLAAFESAASDARTRALPLTAAMLGAERERLASWLGLPALPASDVAPDTSVPGVLFDGGALALGRDGWSETGLTGFEERRAKGRWCTDGEGTLYVGCDKVPGTKLATGDGAATVERSAAWVDCFALAPEWQLPGSWRLDCRIRFLTSYASGAVVFGYREREDNLRCSFGAGDFNYAAGITQKLEHDFSQVDASLGGLRDRDGGLIGGTNGGTVKFDSPRSSFWLTLLVDGPFVEALIDGKPFGRYHTVDGAAIEGQVGFATGMGAVAIEGARVTRTERSRLAGAKPFESRTFDLASPRSPRPWAAAHCPSAGLPRPPQGALVYWVPPPEKPWDERDTQMSFLRRVQRGLRDLANHVARTQPTQPLVVALPAVFDDEGRAWIDAEAKKLLGDQLDIRVHAQPFLAAPPDAAGGKVFVQASAWLLFLDSAGCVRAATTFQSGKVRDEAGFLRWMNVFRDHGHPPRELSELVRETPTGPATEPGKR